MNKRIKKILLWIAGTILVLVLTAVILAFVFEDKVKQQIIVSTNGEILSNGYNNSNIWIDHGNRIK